MAVLLLLSACGLRAERTVAPPPTSPSPAGSPTTTEEETGPEPTYRSLKEPKAAKPRASAAVVPFRGFGAWIDIFDRAYWRSPGAAATEVASHGARTLYLETQSFRFSGDFRFPGQVGTFLEAAHAAGMKVVAWYVPGFRDLRRDLERSVKAIRFRTAAGQAFDGFALDIEATEVGDDRERARRVIELSRDIRRAAGPGYPLGAIVPSPLRSSSYWPVLPMAGLAEIYDVMLPMAYWTGQENDRAGAERYIARSMKIVRSETRQDVPIHMIGGLAEDAGPGEIQGFVNAVRRARVLGSSMYDANSTTDDGWAILERLG